MNLVFKNGILIPVQPGVRCGYCKGIIYQDCEANGRLFLLNGRPICAQCRIMKKSKFANQIRRDKKNYIKDLETKEKILQQKANENVMKVALESQSKK